MLCVGQFQLAEALAETGLGGKMDTGDQKDSCSSSSSEADLESLMQMVEILAEDLRQAKQQIASTQPVGSDVEGSRDPMPSSSDPVSRDESMQDMTATVAATQAANQRLEEELDSVRHENEALTQEIFGLRDRLEQSGVDLEEARMERAENDDDNDVDENNAKDDDGDESTVTEAEEPVGADCVQEDGNDDEVDDNGPLESSPRSKRQRMDESQQSAETLE